MSDSKGSRFLSQLVLNRTYAATLPTGVKETKEQVIDRVLSHHAKRYPSFANDILSLRTQLVEGKVVPAMRWMQFAGEGIERCHVKGFNCSYTTIESFRDFSEVFFILMCGTGVGYSVRRRHVSRLPVVQPGYTDRIAINDSKEGWADSVLSLLENPSVRFDYTLIRPAGAALSTGGTASGPEPLRHMHELMRSIILNAVGRQLTPIEVHDLICIISDAVVVGGVRRAALISIFDPDDDEMLRAKHGEWWNTHPWRARANNSAALMRQNPNARQQFLDIMQKCHDSNAGEPGIFWTEDEDWGTNPCAEIALRPKQMCNLTEVNLAACKTFEELVEAVRAATILGTLQASYTDFNYLDPKWRENCNEEALLGVSLTGLAENWGLLGSKWQVKYLASYMKAINKSWADKIGVNPAARLGCVKPSGTASAYLGTTSGIHAAHSTHFLRRVRIDVTHPVSRYLETVLPKEFLEKDVFNPSNYVVSIPIKMNGDITRQSEGSLKLLERMKFITDHWVHASHRSGVNKHNVSITVSYKKEEWNDIVEWMWDNRETYAGISLLPYDDSAYVQMPFESIDKETYNVLLSKFPDIDFSKVQYVGRGDDRQEESACAGGQCTFGL